MRVVIIGNGVAGMEAALTLRAREPDWPITIVSEESDHFFSRTALMYVLSGQLSHACIEPLERSTYALSNFTRVRARATGIDADRHLLHLANGDHVAYDKLIIASGSRPRPAPFWPGYDTLKGIGHFVTLQDLTWLEGEVQSKLSRKRPPNEHAHLDVSTPDSPYQPRPTAAEFNGKRAKRPVIIGGGLIGIEVVETMLAAGLTPTFLIREDAFWPIALDKREAAWIAEELRHHGCEVRLSENVERFEGETTVQRVVTDLDVHDTDLVIVAIGVVPNTDWVGDAVELDERHRGILVNRQLQTSHPDIYACGDCASVEWFNGWVRPEQLWYTGRDQGRAAARAVLGDDVHYARGTFYNSAKLMDIEYTTAGLVNMKVEGEESWYFEETGAVRSTTRIVHVDGRVVGFNFLGRRWDTEVCIRWIEERRPIDYVLEHLDEARFDTEFVPALKIPAASAAK
ncbi:MAG: NAD(P)/FAD-dependent oxidoreductase [Myxococcota bacterium]